MPSSMAIALSTRGHVCRAPDAVQLVDELVPQLNASSLEPIITTEGQKTPDFTILSVEPQVPEVAAETAGFPVFEVGVIEPVPTADTKKDSKVPEVKIRPVVDLRPIIVKKGD